MADFSTTLKNVFSKSVKFVGKTAKSAAKSTKYKLDELSNLSKRRDLISELGNKVYELAQAGLVLPAEAAEIAKQITMLDGDLAVMRADHAAEKAAAAEQHAAEKAARAAEKAAAKTAAAIEKSTAVVDVELPEVAAPEAECEVNAEVGEVPTLNVTPESADKEAETEVPTLNV